MKNILLVFILAFSIHTYGQVNDSLKEDWNTLKEALQHRSELTLDLVSVLKDKKEMDQAELQAAKKIAEDLLVTYKNTDLNNVQIQLIYNRNTELTTQLVHILVNLEMNIKLRDSNKVQYITDQLAVAENNILSAANRYNKNCTTLNKPELLFKVTADKQSPQVKFE